VTAFSSQPIGPAVKPKYRPHVPGKAGPETKRPLWVGASIFGGCVPQKGTAPTFRNFHDQWRTHDSSSNLSASLVGAQPLVQPSHRHASARTETKLKTPSLNATRSKGSLEARQAPIAHQWPATSTTLMHKISGRQRLVEVLAHTAGTQQATNLTK
jgi:hypothetical protein